MAAESTGILRKIIGKGTDPEAVGADQELIASYRDGLWIWPHHIDRSDDEEDAFGLCIGLRGPESDVTAIRAIESRAPARIHSVKQACKCLTRSKDPVNPWSEIGEFNNGDPVVDFQLVRKGGVDVKVE